LIQFYNEDQSYTLDDGRDFISLCPKAAAFHDSLTNRKDGIKISESLGILGQFMNQAAETAAKKIKRRQARGR
jgi:hypothetical protein